MSKETLVIISSSDSKPEIASAWDGYSGTLLMTYKGEGVPARNGLAVGGGCMMACVKNKAQMFAWALNGQHALNKRLVGRGGFNAIALSPVHGHYLAAAVKETLYVYHINTGALIGFGSAHFQNINTITFSSDGILIACGGDDGLVTLWNLTDMSQTEAVQPRHTISSHSVSVIGLKFCGSKLLSCSADKTIGLLDLNSFTQSVSIGLEKIPSAFTVAQETIFLGAHDGCITSLAFSSIMGLSEAHIDQNSCLSISLHESSVTDMTHSPDQQLLISASMDQTIKLWHIRYKNLIRTIKTKTPIVNIVCFDTLKSVFTAGIRPLLSVQDFNDSQDMKLNLSNRIEMSDLCATVNETGQNTSSTMVQNLKNEVDRLKVVNYELYKHCMKKNLEAVKKVRPIKLSLAHN